MISVSPSGCELQIQDSHLTANLMRVSYALHICKSTPGRTRTFVPLGVGQVPLPLGHEGISSTARVLDHGQ